MRIDAGVSFALNVQLCLGMQLIGGGRSEADIILSFLNLPNGDYMKRQMLTIENKLGQIIRRIGSQQMRSALEEEIFEQLIYEGREGDFKKWKNGECVRRVFLTVSFDMGWNKRSTGTRYDSKSGHTLLVGERTKKVISINIFSIINFIYY